MYTAKDDKETKRRGVGNRGMGVRAIGGQRNGGTGDEGTGGWRIGKWGRERGREGRGAYGGGDGEIEQLKKGDLYCKCPYSTSFYTLFDLV